MNSCFFNLQIKLNLKLQITNSLKAVMIEVTRAKNY